MPEYERSYKLQQIIAPEPVQAQNLQKPSDLTYIQASPSRNLNIFSLKISYFCTARTAQSLMWKRLPLVGFGSNRTNLGTVD